MGILTRFKDIMASNINALLDKAEDPEKMIDQCLRNLNNDLGKVKSETAVVMAEEQRAKRELDECTKEINKMQQYAIKALERLCHPYHSKGLSKRFINHLGLGGYCYIYTVEVPQLTDDNHIFSSRPVNEAIIQRAEKKVGETLPEEAKSAGKYFRKYLGNLLIGNRTTVKKMISKADAEAESAAAKFLDSIGVVFLVWPHSQNKPDGDTNRAVLNEHNIKIIDVMEIIVNKIFVEK